VNSATPVPTADPVVDAAQAPTPPGPSLRETPAVLKRLQRNVLGVATDLAETYGDVSMVRAGGQNIVFLRGADVSRHVLVTAQDRYPKPSLFQLFRPALGEGLFTSEGETWRRSRRMVQPLFAKRHLAPYADHMAAAATRALDRWEAEWPADHEIDIDAEILHVGLDTVGRALASYDFSAEASEFERGLGNVLHEIGAMARSPGVMIGQGLKSVGVVRAARLTTPKRWRRYVTDADAMDDRIAEVVDERIRDGHGDHDDLLRLLMETEDDEAGGTLSRRQVIDEIKTFLFAGHETTAHGLSFMQMLLAENPQARDRLHAELDGVLGDRIPTVEDAARLPYLEACFNEAMRLYPPAWHVPRDAAQDDVVGGYRIPAGSRIMVAIWATHRDPAVYPEPEEFRPERWLDDAQKERPRFSFLPFGGGRRACVGQGFAMLNAIVLGAMISQRYTFERTTTGPVRLEASITLRPLHGIPMRPVRRPRLPETAVR
jgi:cytochrome P450